MGDDHSEFGEAVDSAFKLFCTFINEAPLQPHGRKSPKNQRDEIDRNIKDFVKRTALPSLKDYVDRSGDKKNIFPLREMMEAGFSFLENFAKNVNDDDDISYFVIFRSRAVFKGKNYCESMLGTNINITLEDLLEAAKFDTSPDLPDPAPTNKRPLPPRKRPKKYQPK